MERESSGQERTQGSGRVPVLLMIIPGLFLMIAIAYLARSVVEPWLKANFPILIDAVHLNYILMVLIVGLLIRNTVGIPWWAESGVKMSRLCIKTGIILLGTLYSLSSIASLGLTAAVMIAIFVMGSAFLALFLGRRLGMSRGDAAALGAGVGICGVSAIVAAAPAVRAKAAAIGVSIATILAFGVISLFAFPFLGYALGMTPTQFGAWAGTGILNSGQVLAAALAFQPGSNSEALAVAQIFNVVRVVLLPFVVLALAAYMALSEVGEEHEQGVRLGGMQIIISTFPVFVIGFLGMVILNTMGVFGPSKPPSQTLTILREGYAWLFAIGLAGYGMQISFAEMRRAGGAPFMVGFGVGFIKALLALIVVLVLGNALFPQGLFK